MRLLIVRHGDPDYEHDTLTEKGWREAELLSERLSKLPVKEFYVSPLGRAKDTASLTLQKMNREAKECLWLREFDTKIDRPDCPDQKSIAWDWLPEDWTREEEFFRRDLWATQQTMREGLAPGAHEGNGIRVQKKPDVGVGAEYGWVVSNFDALLAEHGYVREGDIYRVAKANCDTLVFFCHFGLECVLLSHLMNVSPMILWHYTCAARRPSPRCIPRSAVPAWHLSASAGSEIPRICMREASLLHFREDFVRPMRVMRNGTIRKQKELS